MVRRRGLLSSFNLNCKDAQLHVLQVECWRFWQIIRYDYHVNVKWVVMFAHSLTVIMSLLLPCGVLIMSDIDKPYLTQADYTSEISLPHLKL